MTRDAAFKIAEQLEDHYTSNSDPGKSESSIRFFAAKTNELKYAIPFNLEIDVLLQWAQIFYSTRRWQKWGDASIKSTMHQAINGLKKRIKAAPDRVFN